MISAIAGTAGIGKTALAVYWAHLVADRFPDGQLYVNLRGFDPGGSTMAPAEAVRGFLDAFGVERVPVSLDAQAALYRSLLAGRRVLVVLDNARDAEQVRPLLPGSPGCLVLVTSRNRLTGLIAAEGAHPLTLDLLTADQARELLARRLGRARVTAESRAVDRIIARCARLPLALTVVAARAATHPTFSLATLATELDSAGSRLDVLDGGDRDAQVRAVFSWSYRQLSEGTARLFRLLGLHPGPDLTMPAAASLAGVPVRQVRPMLAELAHIHLVDEHSPGRITFHDLLRAYAAELAQTVESRTERQSTVHRILDHYVHTAHAAALRFYPRRSTIDLAVPCPGVVPEEFTDHTAALVWFEAEYAVLLGTIQLAAATDRHRHAWQLPWTLVDFFDRRGHWHDWVATQNVALAAARRSGDRHGQAHAHRSLGRAFPWVGRYVEAEAHFQQALRLFEELDDQSGQAHTHVDLGWVCDYLDRPGEAIPHAQRALTLSRTCGDRPGQARALNNIGWYNANLGNAEEAVAYCQDALALTRSLGDRRGEAYTLDSLGYAHNQLGNHEKATVCYLQSLALHREIGDRYGEATILTHIGDVQHTTGERTAARRTWQHALDILDQLGHPGADRLRSKLATLDTAPN